MQIAVVGLGPAGLAVAEALLDAAPERLTLNLLERSPRPDALLRHGPAAGPEVLRAVAARLQAVLEDGRVTVHCGVEVGRTLSWESLRAATSAVVLATGAPCDLPLAVPGSDAVGIGTLTHLAAWAAGSADASAAEFYGSVDTAVLVGWSPAAAGAVSQLRMLASRGLRQDLLKVSVVDSRAFDELGVTEGVHVVSGATPLAVVGRNRARALRVTTRDVANRLVVQDVRAQLVLRPRGTPALDLPVDVRQDRIRHRCGRVVSVGRVLRYVYVAGWAGRNPLTGGSHAQDAQHVVAMLASDVPPPPLGPSLVELLGPGGTGAWKPIAEVEGLLKRFAGEGSRALADYDDLLSRVEDE